MVQSQMFDLPNHGSSVSNKLIRELKLRDLTETIPSHFHIVQDIAQLQEVVRAAYSAGTIGFDTETRGLHRRDNVVAIGIGIGTQAWFIPTRMVYADRNFQVEEINEHLSDMLSDRSVSKIMHNGKFDMIHMNADYSVDIKGFTHDTIIAQKILNENEPHNLEDVCETWLGTKTWKIKNDGHFDTWPMKVATNYLCGDAYNVLELAKFQNGHFDRLPRLKSLMFDVEQPYIDIVYRMEKRGIEWDNEYYETVMRPFVMNNRLKYKAEVEAILGSINLNSPTQMSRALFDGLRLPRINGDSINKQALAALRKMHPVIDSLVQYRKFDTLYKNYVLTLPDYIENNRIHTTIKTIGAKTGRSSAADPNLMKLPKKSIGPVIRRAFIPSRGHVLIALDYSQIELRILAHLSGDAKMAQAFHSGDDFHSLTAHNMFGTPMAAMDPKLGGSKDLPYRITGKTINFGIPYGMGPQLLMETVNAELSKIDGADLMTFSQSRESLDLYFATFPDVAHYLTRMKANAFSNGYVETLFGRKRRLPDMHHFDKGVVAGAARQAGNAPIQGTAADIFKIASIQMDTLIRKNRWPYHALLAIHDEWLGEVPRDFLSHNRSTLDVLAATMRDAVKLSVPIEVSVEVLARWGDRIDEDSLDVEIEEDTA